MADCWASSLGNCGGGSSREHLASKGLFVSTHVTVEGFPWCRGSAKTIGIESLTSKILCRDHNAALSALDSAASEAFDALRQQTKLCNERAALPPGKPITTEHFYIDAQKLERWLLKTLLNLSYQGRFKIGTSGTEIGIPPDDLVRICFGLADFPGRAGMYVAAKAGMALQFSDVLEFSPLIKDEHRVLGAFFRFRGVRFFLALMREGLSVPLESIPDLSADWTDARLMRPFHKMQALHGGRLSHVVEFRW